MIAASTDRRWELLENGLLVFERPPDPPAESRVLVSRVESCSTPDCLCREVGLRAVVLDVGGQDGRPELLGDDAQARFTSSGAVNAQLDLDFGFLEPDDREGRVPLPDDWIGYVQSQIDGDLLDLLHDRWLSAKGRTVAAVDWEPRAPDELVAWGEAHPDARLDHYLDHYLDQADEDRCFIAQDLYCVNPTCTCREVLIEFAPVKYPARNIGAILVRFPDLQVVKRMVTPTKADLLDRLWSAFLARHPRLAERCARRKQRLIELETCRVAARTPVTHSADRVGRNAPCPCGSGKKYKRCCGA